MEVQKSTIPAKMRSKYHKYFKNPCKNKDDELKQYMFLNLMMMEIHPDFFESFRKVNNILIKELCRDDN